MEERGTRQARIETTAGILGAEAAGNGAVTIDMGGPRLDWRDIPLAEERDTLHVGLSRGPLHDPVAVNVGNPHAVFFVDDAEAIDLGRLGPDLETDPLFPERANISAAQVGGRDAIRLRVWERGVGLTRACGTAACATLVAASRRDLTARRARVRLDGGALEIEWRADDHVVMTGPVATSFTGTLEQALLT